MKGQNSGRWSRDLLTVFGLALFALLLVFLFNVNPVYAPEPDMLCEGDNERCPGGGGGGGTTPPPSSWMIDGYVVDFETGATIPNMPVYLYTGGAIPLSTTTSSSGYFKFVSNLIDANSQYMITVNGVDSSLGYARFDCHWGQIAALVYTDSNGYAYKHVRLQRVAEVNVPAAAIFSNTKYATLMYEMTGTHSISHTLTFSVSSPISASAGYETSKSYEYTSTFTTFPLTQSKIVHRYYAATYWDDRIPGVAKAGIAGADPSWNWDMLATNEYLTPRTIPNHLEHRIDANRSLTGQYTETGSAIWSAGAGVPFAIHYIAFGATINLDTTVTAAATNTVKYEINRYPDSNPNLLTFWVYTRGELITVPETGGNGTGGFELHVWDYSGAG